MKPHEKDWWWKEDRLREKFTAEAKAICGDHPELLSRVDVLFRAFRRREERPAFLYELGRRAKKKEMGDLPPWDKLPPEKRNRIVWSLGYISEADPLFSPPLVVKEMPTGEKIRAHQMPQGWSPQAIFAVNLYESDSAINAAFQKWLRSCRAANKVSAPKPNTGKKRRRRSWVPIEVFDMPCFDGSTSLASIKSKALKQAKSILLPAVVDVFLEA